MKRKNHYGSSIFTLACERESKFEIPISKQKRKHQEEAEKKYVSKWKLKQMRRRRERKVLDMADPSEYEPIVQRSISFSVTNYL